MSSGIGAAGIGWLTIVRLGLVNMAIGSFVMLATTVLNRVMVVELAMLATIPAGLVALLRMVQVTRARWGYDSDRGGSRTPWIVGGMAVLCGGGILAALATALIETAPVMGTLLATLAFVAMGLGSAAAGTCFLALLASRITPRRRAAAATIAWMMMIFGIIVASVVVGKLLQPFSLTRLVPVTTGLAACAFALTLIGVVGVERKTRPVDAGGQSAPPTGFWNGMGRLWSQPRVRAFTIFIFVSMLAFSASDLILEPFAGLVFGMNPGESTLLSGVQHQGVFLGMALVGILGSGFGIGSLRFWTVAGCLGSALVLAALTMGGFAAADWPIRANVFALGFANGVFAIGAIGTMMGLASEDGASTGTRMGLFGTAQTIAFASGGMVGAVAVDLMRAFVDSPVAAYGTVFAAEAALFAASAVLAMGLRETASMSPDFEAAMVAGE
jgi:BCD family chlorophyll transporter-like MFS transporter